MVILKTEVILNSIDLLKEKKKLFKLSTIHPFIHIINQYFKKREQGLRS